MKHIKSMLNYGKNNRCLIVGGGLSIEKFAWECVPGDLDIICTNDHMTSFADIIVYYDKEMQAYYNKKDIADNQILIGFKNGKIDYTIKRCDYYYQYDDVYYDGSIGDSGFHTLRFADQLWNYDEIYLIGFDYWVLKNRYHGDKSADDERFVNNFKTHSIRRVLPKYDRVDWIHKIYNCSNDSKLRKFKFRLPT